MSVVEMGQRLGLRKTTAYWLVHKGCFKTVLVQGIMRVDIESFEHWYANQTKHRKVDGTPPGEALRAYSYSVQEIAELLAVSDYVIYTLIQRHQLETFEVDTRMRVRKDVFEKWYRSQTKYRTEEDRKRDAEVESSSMTMPQMARLLGITRDEVYLILGKKRNRGVFDIVVVGDKKRVTYESFENWYRNQSRYQKVTGKISGLQEELKKAEDSAGKTLLDSERTSFTPSETATLIGVPQRDVYRMIEEGILDSFTIGKMIRIRRASLEWWLSSQGEVFRREEK